jgi:hypothetical protein
MPERILFSKRQAAQTLSISLRTLDKLIVLKRLWSEDPKNVEGSHHARLVKVKRLSPSGDCNGCLFSYAAADPSRSLTTVGQKPSIEIEQATSSYSFRFPELSQPI